MDKLLQTLTFPFPKRVRILTVRLPTYGEHDVEDDENKLAQLSAQIQSHDVNLTLFTQKNRRVDGLLAQGFSLQYGTTNNTMLRLLLNGSHKGISFNALLTSMKLQRRS